MQSHPVLPAKAAPGDKVAVLSPSFAAPGIAPEVHEQAMKRLEEKTGLVPVEYPTTRRLGASARDRAADLNAAFADPEIRAVLATIGGEDQITVVPHLDADLVRADPSRSWATATTPTCSAGCGSTGWQASTAAPRRSSSARDRPSTRCTRGRCVLPC